MHSSSAHRPAHHTPAHPFLVLSLLGALCVISPFAIDLYLPAFRQMADDLGTSSAVVSLSLSSYFIGLALGQFIYGPLLDRYGRKRPIYAGLGVFCLASVGCTMTDSVEMLIALRLLQGLGGCGAQIAAITMVHDFFPPAQSARIFSRLFLFIGASPLFAPAIGGLLADAFGWRSVFIFMLLLAGLILSAIVLFLPEGHKPDPGISLKPRDIFGIFGGILRHPVFLAYTLPGALSLSGLFGYLAGAPIIFMEQFGVSARGFGLIFSILAAGFIGASQVNVVLLRRYSSDVLFRIALTAQAVCGALFLLCSALGMLDLTGTVAVLFVFLATVGISNPNGSALALAAFDKNAGSASAMLGAVQLGIGAVVSTMIGIFKAGSSLPVVAVLFASALAAVLTYAMLRKNIGKTPADVPE